ncbi:hypothetical protein K439DRAFT_323746 [Ramaria rubella]|nr:hypothetical protein K439DRAFT_323746 [Ramaria rubella]
MHHTLPAGAEDDMLTALTHYYIARINLDLDIISPFSHTQCQQLLSLFETIKQETTSTLGIRACFVSSVLATIWETRQQYHWGEYDAKSSFIQTGNLEHPTLLRRFLEAWIHVLCFGTHGRYLVQLKLAQANGSTYRPDFDKFLEDLLQEWTDSNLLGTVFVSANMAFLAVGEITKSQQTIVLLSTFFSMASIVSGVHHIWKHRPKTNADADESRRYITRANILFPAMFLSFPLVFLLWSVLTFAVALLDFAFFHSQVVPRVLIACIVSFILFTTVCMRAFFYNIWEEPDLTDKSTGIVKRSWHALQRLSAFRHDESDETSESDASSISSKKVDTRIQRLMVGIQNLRRTKNTTKGAHV